MSDKNIEIGIGIDGAEEAAADVKKVSKSIENLGGSGTAGKSIAALEGQLESLQRELRQLDVGSEAFRKMIPRIQAAEKALESAKMEAIAMGASLGRGPGGAGVGGQIQQLGYQVGDFAVQVGMGTSAMTAFAQQGSQMLGAFGPAGAIAGALLAVGAAIGNAMGRAKADAGDAADSIDVLDGALAAAGQRAMEWAEAEAALIDRRFIGSLDDREQATKRVNDEIAKSIELMRKRRVLELELVDARAAERIAQVDADEGLTEPEKIRRRAEIQRESLAKRREAELAEIADSTAPAAAAARKAKERLEEQGSNIERDRGTADSLREEINRLAEIVKRSEVKNERVKRLEEAIPEAIEGLSGVGGYVARSKINQGRPREQVVSPNGNSPELDAQVNRIYDMMDELQRLRNDPDRLGSVKDPNGGGTTSNEAIRLRELEGTLQEKEEDIAKREKELAALAEASRKAAEAYEEAAAEAKRTEEIRRKIYQAQDRRFDIETDSKTKAARGRMSTYGPELPPGFIEANNEAVDLANKIAEVAKTGKSNGGDAQVIKALENAARALEDGTSRSELVRSSQDIARAAEQSGAAASRALDAIAQQLKSLTDRFESFERTTRKKFRK